MHDFTFIRVEQHFPILRPTEHLEISVLLFLCSVDYRYVDEDVVKWLAQAKASMPASYIPIHSLFAPGPICSPERIGQ